MDVIKTYKRIKLVVKKRNMTLIQLAENTGVSINTIKKWGQGVEPTLGNLLTIAHELDVSMDYLMGDTEDWDSHKSGFTKSIEAYEKIQKYAQKEISEIMEQLERAKDIG